MTGASSMQLIDHLAALVFVEPETNKYILPKCAFPTNDTTNILQNFVTSLASLGCRSIWFCTFDNIPEIYKEILGDFVPDPICYQIEPSKIEDNLIPIIYTQLIANIKQSKVIDIAVWMAMYKIIIQTTRYNSKYLEPEKYLLITPDIAFDTRECEKLKQKLLLKDDYDWEFLDQNKKRMFLLYTKERMQYMRKMLRLKYKHEWLFKRFFRKEYIFENAYKFDNLLDYSNIIQNELITKFEWTQEFEKYKKIPSGLNDQFIGKETVIHRKVKTK